MSRLIAVLKYAGLTLAILITGSVIALAQMPDLNPLPGTGNLSASANSAQFIFVLAGDNRPAGKTCKQPPTPGKIMSAVNQMSPPAAFVLWTGDTISGKQPENPKLMRQQYAEFLDIAKQAGVPVFNAPGNHEMDDGDNCPSKDMQKLYEENMAGTYGAFTYGNSRFIALDSEHSAKPCKKPPKGKKNEAPGSITDKELKLLQQDLDADKNLAHVFIFMHHPVKPYKAKDGLDDASAEALKKLFKNYSNVSYVVAGHEHMYMYANREDPWADPPSRTDPSQPPFYLVSGGAGAPLKQGTGGSFFHYLIFKVDGNQVSPSLVKVDSKDPCDKKSPK